MAMRQKFEVQVKRDRDVWMVLAVVRVDYCWLKLESVSSHAASEDKAVHMQDPKNSPLLEVRAPTGSE
jgi:hypothetical protein